MKPDYKSDVILRIEKLEKRVAKLEKEVKQGPDPRLLNSRGSYS